MRPDIEDNDTLAVTALLGMRPAALSAWYGNPLATAMAEDLLARAQEFRQARLCADEPRFQLQVLMLISHTWLGSEPDFDPADLATQAAGRHERALLDLVQGQLLASRKCRGAMACLERGFRQAAPCLAPNEYFALLRRHELIECLPFGDLPSPAQDLVCLLKEAAVIKTLRAGQRRTHPSLHRDTVG
jgi:hypothetical protein